MPEISETADQAIRKVRALNWGFRREHIHEVLSKAKTIEPDRPIRAIDVWIWVDLVMADSDREHFLQKGLLPAMLAGKMFYTDPRMVGFDVGLWVKSSLLQRTVEPYIAISQNTSYLLKGWGARIELPFEEVDSILSASFMTEIHNAAYVPGYIEKEPWLW